LPSEEQIGRNWFGPKLQRRENPANKGSMEKKRVMFKKGYWKKEKDKGYRCLYKIKSATKTKRCAYT